MRRAEKIQIAIALGGLLIAGVALSRQASPKQQLRQVTLHAGKSYRVTMSVFPPRGTSAQALLDKQVQNDDLLDTVFEPLGASDVDVAVLPASNELLLSATIPITVTHRVTLDGEMPLPANIPPDVAPRIVIRSVRGPV